MAIKTFTTGEVLTASDTNTYLANAGLVYVASATFSAVSSVQINNCFTSTMDHYRIMYSGVGTTSGNDFIYGRLVDGTTPTTAANYYHGTAYSTTGSSWANGWVGSQTAWKWAFTGDNRSQFALDLFDPQTTNKTTFSSQMFSSATGDALWGVFGGLYNTTTQFEGVQIYPGSGTFTGTLTVYGYRKA